MNPDDALALFRAWYLTAAGAAALFLGGVVAGWAAWRASRRGRW